MKEIVSYVTSCFPLRGAKNVLPLNLIALLIGGGFFIPTSSGVSGLWYNEGMQRLVTSD